MKRLFFLAKISKVMAVALLSGILLAGCSSTPSIRKTFKEAPEELRIDIMSAAGSGKIQLDMIQDYDDNTYIIIDKEAYDRLSSDDLYTLAKAIMAINESQPVCDTLVNKDVYFYDSDKNIILLDSTLNLYEVISKMYRTLDDNATLYTSEELISKMEKYKEGIGKEFTAKQEEQYNYYHNDNNTYSSYYYSLEMKQKEQDAEAQRQEAARQARLAEEKRAANLKNSEPYIGMSESDINNTAWGRYEDKNETITRYGTHTQYCFSGYRYVYTENGVVTSIQK